VAVVLHKSDDLPFIIQILLTVSRVGPMYTSDIKNRQHQSMLECWRRRIADIDFVKKIVSSVQRHWSQICASRCGRSSTPPTAVAVSDVGGRLAGGVGKDTGMARCQMRPLWHGIEPHVTCVWWTAWPSIRGLSGGKCQAL